MPRISSTIRSKSSTTKETCSENGAKEEGSGKGQFEQPISVARQERKVFVVDMSNDRVQVSLVADTLNDRVLVFAWRK